MFYFASLAYWFDAVVLRIINQWQVENITNEWASEANSCCKSG